MPTPRAANETPAQARDTSAATLPITRTERAPNRTPAIDFTPRLYHPGPRAVQPDTRTATPPPAGSNSARLQTGCKRPPRRPRTRFRTPLQRRSLFDSMSNHIAKSVNWLPAISSSATSTIVAVGDPVAEDAEHRLDDPEREADERHHEPEAVEEDERVEVADHVLLAQPPEEALQEQPRDARHDLAEPDPRALADAVDRARREVAHARVPRRSGGRAGRSGSRSACRCGRGRAARASPARSPCSPPASRRRASSRTRSSSAARAPRCRGSGVRGISSQARPLKRRFAFA